MDFQNRHTDHDIYPAVLKRWSPRAFSTKPIDEKKLNAVFEAARWAPSCFNEQPWRFVIAVSEEEREQFVGFLNPSNQIWAKNAPVLFAIVSKTTFEQNGKSNRWNGFDAGCAWGILALEAYRQGLYTHAMGGFSREEGRKVMSLPEDYEIYAMVAMGELGDKENLPADLQERETPSERNALENILYRGRFKD